VPEEDVKQQIRRRLYAQRLKAQQPPGELADFFVTCPRCRGRGEVGSSDVQNGVAVEADGPCPTCNGDRFIPTPRSPDVPDAAK
jgi:DnaJ-class molecular chaperone